MGAVLAVSFLTALAVGLATGFERETRGVHDQTPVICGVRSFTFVAILGFFNIWLVEDVNVLLTIVLLLIVLVVPLLKALRGKIGMTTAVALIVVFSVGTLCGLGMFIEGAVVGMINLIVLSSKRYTRSLAGIMTHEEMEGLVQFVALAAVLLPITYWTGDVHHHIGPGRMIDPFKIVLMIVFVSSISFTSFVVMKVTGASKGLEISSFLAGFVNSAACTASLAQRGAKNPTLRGTLKKSIVLTNTSMILKDIIIISVVAGIGVGSLLLLPVVILIGISFSVLYRSGDRKEVQNIDIDVRNPFAIFPALKFGALFLFISSFSHLSVSLMGDYGVYASSLAGLVSTTSVSASMGLLYSTGTIGGEVAVSTVLLALALGSLSKVAISITYDKMLGKELAIPMVLLAVVSSLMAFFSL